MVQTTNNSHKRKRKFPSSRREHTAHSSGDNIIVQSVSIPVSSDSSSEEQPRHRITIYKTITDTSKAKRKKEMQTQHKVAHLRKSKVKHPRQTSYLPSVKQKRRD